MSTVNNLTTYSKGQTVITNEKEQPINVYVPNFNSTVKKDGTSALSYYDLAPGKSLKVESTEPVSTYSLTGFKMTDETRKGSYDYVRYDASGTINAFSSNNKLTTTYDTVYVSQKGETIIENTGDSTIQVYGPSRYIKVSTTNEPALSYYDLEPGKSLRIESTEPVSNYSSTGFKITDETRKGSYDYVRYDASGTINSFYSNNKLTTTYDTFYVSQKGETIIENTGDGTIQVYGPSRYIEASTTNESASSYYDLKPGKSLKIESTEPVSNYSSTGFKITDETRKGSYDYVRYDASGTINSFYSNNKLTTTYDTVYVSQKGETIIENTGDSTIQVYGPSRYIEASTTNESALSYYDITPGQTVKVSSTEQGSDYVSTDFKMVDETRKGSYDYIRYDASGKIYSSMEGNKLTGSYSTIYVSKRGETIIKNTGGTIIKVYGPSRYLIVN